MATRNQNQTLDPAAGTSSAPVPVEPEELVRQFRELAERLPHPQAAPGNRPFRRRLAHIDPKFVTLAINAIGSAPPAQAALTRTDDDLRLEVAVIERWSAVTDELKAMLRTVLADNDIRRQRLGLKAMQAYRICEQLERDSGDEKLTAYVREMRRMDKFGRRRRRPGTPPELPPDVVATQK